MAQNEPSFTSTKQEIPCTGCEEKLAPASCPEAGPSTNVAAGNTARPTRPAGAFLGMPKTSSRAWLGLLPPSTWPMPVSPPEPVAPPAPSAPAAPLVPVVPPALAPAELEPATFAPAEADEPASLTAPPFAGQGSRGSSMCTEQPTRPTPATKSDSVNDVESFRIARFPSIFRGRAQLRARQLGAHTPRRSA